MGEGVGESVHERLFRQNSSNEQKLRALREAEAAACTFRPSVSERAQSCGRVRPRGTSIFDMLHSDNAVRLATAVKLEEQRAAKEVVGCTHKPVISEQSRSVARAAARAASVGKAGAAVAGGGSIFDRLSGTGTKVAEAAVVEHASPSTEIVHTV